LNNKNIFQQNLVFARFYLLCRFIIYHSHLFRDVSSQSLGYLNQVSINFSLIIKTYLERWPLRCLFIFCVLIFFIGSWSLRACDYQIATEHLPMLDAMWLFIVTYLTVGYGDLTPSTYCGRSKLMFFSEK
jgi:potassium intermediate/small conductance calcium-activated channel subfamily N